MMELPVRFADCFEFSVPSSDWRTHPNTPIGDQYLYGNGIVHQDLVNVPFYGHLYDTAIIAHPLSPSDCLFDSRIKVTHIQFVMCQLRDIQRQARNDRRTTLGELRARRDSIEVLEMLRRKAFARLRDRYFAQKANEAPNVNSAPEDSDDEFIACHSFWDSLDSSVSPEESPTQDSPPTAPLCDSKSTAQIGTPSVTKRCPEYQSSTAKKSSRPREESAPIV